MTDGVINLGLSCAGYYGSSVGRLNGYSGSYDEQSQFTALEQVARTHEPRKLLIIPAANAGHHILPRIACCRHPQSGARG